MCVCPCMASFTQKFSCFWYESRKVFQFFALNCPYLLSLLSSYQCHWLCFYVKHNFQSPYNSFSSNTTFLNQWTAHILCWRLLLFFLPVSCDIHGLMGASLLDASDSCCQRCLCHHRSHSLLAKLILNQQRRGNKLKPFPLRRSNTDWGRSWRGGGVVEGGERAVIFLPRSLVLHLEFLVRAWWLTRRQIKLRMHRNIFD